MTQKLTPLSALLSVGLNAPFGARCFMTRVWRRRATRLARLNAPFGARCFMTVYELADIQNITAQLVLMHRLALGAL